jgi:DNA-binding XRE family transcriptional regulator
MMDRQEIPTNEQIKVARVALGKTQETMARIFGVTHATWNRWERGHCAPMPSFREKMWKLIEMAGKHKKGA